MKMLLTMPKSERLLICCAVEILPISSQVDVTKCTPPRNLFDKNSIATCKSAAP